MEGHRSPLIYGIQYFTENHFFLILYFIKQQKYIIMDSLKKNHKSYYLLSVIHLNYLIEFVDMKVDLPFKISSYLNKSNININFKQLLQNNVLKPIVLDSIIIFEEFWQQSNNNDSSIYTWIFLFSL
jgi:hypothetical protein